MSNIRNHTTDNNINTADIDLLTMSQAMSELKTGIHYKHSGQTLDFKRIDKKSMDKIWPYLQQEKGRTTDFSYGGILMWVDYFKYEYAIFNDTLFIKGRVENDRSKVAFALPIGKMPLVESVPILRHYCDIKGLNLEFSAVPEYAMAGFMALNPRIIEPLEDWGDYLYRCSDLATLSGKKYGKKRNHINKFVENNPDWHMERLMPENISLARRLMDKYESELDNAPMGIEESRLTRKMLDLMEQGNSHLVGGILFGSDGPCAFTIGDIKHDTLFIHIEKGTRETSGSYEMINHTFAKIISDSIPTVRYINREDDSGDPGLRRSKQSYHPVEILKKFNVIF